MLQNKYSFNQSSTELVISGLPDFSNNDNKDNISIISSWKLSILNQPDIEGGINHLEVVIRAFYNCASLSLLNRDVKFESDFIDIELDINDKYKITLKSSKPAVKPLNFEIGYAEFADIINCIDQLNQSENIKVSFNDLYPTIKKQKIYFKDRVNILESFLPPLLAAFSISILTIIGSSFYQFEDDRKNDLSMIKYRLPSDNSLLMIKIK